MAVQILMRRHVHNARAQVDQEVLRCACEVAVTVQRQHAPAALGHNVLNLDVVIDAERRHHNLC